MSHAEPSRQVSNGGAGPDNVSDHDINRLVFEAQVSALPEGMPSFPWEQGVLRHIFDDHALLQRPRWKQPTALLVSGTSGRLGQDEEVGAKRSAPVASSLFGSCISSNRTSRFDDEDHAWSVACGKWMSVFSLVDFEGEVGSLLLENYWAHNTEASEAVLMDIFSLKAASTVTKRANTILRALRWHLDHRYAAWPWSIGTLGDYVDTFDCNKGGASAILALFEAIRFSHFVLKLPFPQSILEDKRLQGRAKRFRAESGALKEAAALTVEQVCKLEDLLDDERSCAADRYLLGGLLFALLSRSRWSDLRKLQFIAFDRQAGGQGFVEAATFHHKTCHTNKAVKRAMPLVAPCRGISGRDWSAIWEEAGNQLGVQWDAIPFGPLVRAVDGKGQLVGRRCTSQEATSLLLKALGTNGPSGISSRSLKVTTLNWAGKRGFGEKDALLLGHHVTGSKSRAVYSRELLSAPLRLYCAMLQEIRDGRFRPDMSRSGWLSQDCLARPPPEEFGAANFPPMHSAGTAPEPEFGCVPLPSNGEAAGVGLPFVASEGPDSSGLSFECVSQPAFDDLDEPIAFEPSETSKGLREEQADAENTHEGSSSTSSSTSASEPSDGSEAEESTLRRAGAVQTFEVDGPLWQHRSSKMLHRAKGCEGDARTVCGRRTGSAYVHLPGAVARWPRCAVCFKGQIISNKKDLVKALDVLTSS